MLTSRSSEEQQPLEDFFKAKNIRFKNEMLDDSATLLAATLDPEELASSEDEVGGGVRGSADGMGSGVRPRLRLRRYSSRGTNTVCTRTLARVICAMLSLALPH